MSATDPLVRDVLALLESRLDPKQLRDCVARHVKPTPAAPPQAAAAPVPAVQHVSKYSGDETVKKLQERIGLADILGDDILHAGRGDQAFPLRLFFGQLVTDAATDDAAFALASGLNLYFRAEMLEDSKVRIGLEVSRLYYRFAAKSLEEAHARPLAPLLAQLMNSELDQLALESVDHVRVFDSSIHERAPQADEGSSRVARPLTFLCRVATTQRPRFKAIVVT